MQVPAGYASDGQIVLNVAPSAVRHLHMDNEAISFEGRFGGVAHSLNVPSAAVMAIYARKTGKAWCSRSSRLHWTMTRRAMLVALQEERAATGRSPESEGRKMR